MQFDRHSQLGEMQLSAAVEAAEYNLVATLGLAPYPDGDQWCVLWGKDLQGGVCGFGETPYLAVLAFNKACHQRLALKPEAPDDRD